MSLPAECHGFAYLNVVNAKFKLVQEIETKVCKSCVQWSVL